MLLFAMVAFTACKKDNVKKDDDKKEDVKPDDDKKGDDDETGGNDETGGVTTALLVGKWQMETVAFDDEPPVTVPANRASFITISANGSVNLDIWNILGDDPEYWIKEESEDATYTISGQSIAITYEDNTKETYTVKELTASRLVLEIRSNGVKLTSTFKKV